MIALAIVLIVGVCLYVLDRQATRHQVELARKDTVIDRLVERVQHPEVALPDLDAKPADPASLYVSSFDDEGFNRLKSGE